MMTTAYHPESNGMIERSHRQVKDVLKTRLAGSDWPLRLSWVLLSLPTGTVKPLLPNWFLVHRSLS
jgi:hypothetical protein